MNYLILKIKFRIISNTIKARRSRFQEISLGLFYKKGYRATTMRDIADEMGCEVGNIYNYTKSKHAILEEHLFDMSKRFHDGMDHILMMENDAKVKIELVINLHISLASAHPLKASLLVNDWRNLQEEKLKVFLHERTDYENKLKKIIRKGVKTGSFRKLDIEICIKTLLPALRWVYNYFSSDKKRHSAKFLEKEMKAILLNGLLEK